MSVVWFPATDNLQDGEIHLCAGGLRHCGISTELKFHEFATKPDAVALLPTSYDCEDEEYVDGSAVSPATVHVAELVHRLELSAVHIHSRLYLFQTYWTRVSLVLFPDSSRHQLLSAEWDLGMTL